MIKGGMPPLGLGEAEERAYEALLLERAERVEELALLLDLPSERVHTALDRLVEHGFARPADPAEKGGLPHPAAPATAIRTLIDRRQEELHRRSAELERLRSTAERLAAERAAAARTGAGGVEAVTGRRAVDERVGRLIAGAEREVLLMDRPPYACLDVGGLLARGVEVRAVLDRAGFAAPGRARAVAALARRGLRVRVAAGVPTRLVAVDRRVTLLPPADPADPRAYALVVADARLREALVPLFEAVWERAVPLECAGAGAAAGPGTGPAGAGPVGAGAGVARTGPEGGGTADTGVAGVAGTGAGAAGAPAGGPGPAPVAVVGGASAGGAAAGLRRDGGAGGGAEQRELLRLLAAGLKDEAIARRLGVHVHTARRRISRLLEALDARTRFQAGARATARGWLEP
ncbi:LuxR family transcriptional regulator [Streptomyces sp. DH12]|uniref:helix-turn-helix transcriptional regulator n=1 Tax=Streptomyces sp. DH12 TaxID=2857010 RepID=UPI001E54F609|nr:LuxR family transcriptional regulator [Streptomyces sp. DH12]